MKPDTVQSKQERLRIGFILARSFTLSAFAMFVDTLRLASDETDRSGRRFADWQVLGSTRHLITSSCGVQVAPTSDFVDPQEFNYIVVVGGLLSHDKPVDHETIAYLKKAASQKIPLIGVCTGTFILADAGLMKNHQTCVSWLHYDAFRERCRKFYGSSLDGGDLRMEPGYNPELPLLASAADPKRRWVDGTPANTGVLWALERMFPEAIFIHQLRRPADVATSLQGFDRLGAQALPLADGLVAWREHVEAAALAERAFGAGRVFRLAFERIAEAPETLMRDLFDFLGEEYCPDSVATLGRTLNSSQVASRREANAEAMFEMPEYLEASSLYWRLLDQRPPHVPDPAAAEILRDNFEARCRGRSLP